MQHSNGHRHAVITLYDDDDPGWMHDVHSYLVKHDYLAYQVQNAADAWHLLRTNQADALLAADNNPETLRVFQKVRETIPPDDQPLLVALALTEQEVDEAFYTTADLIAMPDPISSLEHQLRAFINLRKRNAELHHENLQLRQELKAERQTNSGIELLKNAIVWNVAHELRTPLLQVKSAVALLAEDASDIGTLIGLAQRAIIRLEAGVLNITLLNELINESLEKRNFEAVPITEIVDSAIRNLRRSWEHRGNVDRIVVHVPKALPPILGDKQRLVIALQLLIDNALRFSKETVDVIFEQVGENIRITIRDYGIGISPENLEKIFDTFFQVEHSSTRSFGGMGIGLAIVRFILERHGTRIHVDSKVGEGSSFSFLLPIAKIDDGSKPSETE